MTVEPVIACHRVDGRAGLDFFTVQSSSCSFSLLQMVGPSSVLWQLLIPKVTQTIFTNPHVHVFTHRKLLFYRCEDDAASQTGWTCTTMMMLTPSTRHMQSCTQATRECSLFCHSRTSTHKYILGREPLPLLSPCGVLHVGRQR